MTRVVAVALLALLVGCASDTPRPTVVTPATVKPAAGPLEVWQAEGRVAIQRGDEGWSASLRWQRDAETFQIRLIAPLGRGTYQLHGGTSLVELTMANGEKYSAVDAQSLMQKHLGWSLPVRGAAHWLTGQVAPHSEAAYVNRDEHGYIVDLQQDGWRVSVLKRIDVGGLELPAKLFFLYGDLKVRIVLKRWTLNAP